MEQSSIIIHKGGREDKYQVYVEDYVLSFLKEETGTLELSEFYFYGFKEKNSRKYTIYGVGRSRRLSVFDKYDLLEEVGCRLTQAGPVFLIREENDTKYEIKGYEVFYQDNREMQNYLIDQKKDSGRSAQNGRREQTDRIAYTDRAEKSKATDKRPPHSVITVQLGIILVALVAIVINTTNSYDKMQELNQSAAEVFFAMENQEAESMAAVDDEKAEIVVERDVMQEEDILKLATLENEEQAEEQNEGDTGARTERQNDGDSEEQAEGRSEEGSKLQMVEGAEQQSDADNDNSAKGESEQNASDGTEEVEALSRNVTRYYEVERGDTLYTISQKIYGDTTYVQKICELNQITNPDNIRYGQKIILP